MPTDFQPPSDPPVRSTECSATWCPMLRTGDLQISLYTDETLEIRDGQAIYAHLTPSETADFLRWIDARDKSPNDKLTHGATP